MTDLRWGRWQVRLSVPALIAACSFGLASATVASTPPMYLVAFEYVAVGEVEHGIIKHASEAVLENAIAAFWSTPDNSVCIIGNYDRTGLAQDRIKKSQVLAESVKEYLVAQGVPMSSISTDGKGDLEPQVPTADGVEEPANRYVLVLVGTDNYKPSC